MLNKEKRSYRRPRVKHIKKPKTPQVSKRLAVSLVLSLVAFALYIPGYKYTAEARRVRELEAIKSQLIEKEILLENSSSDSVEKQKQLDELNKQLEETKKQLEAKLSVKKALAERAPIPAAYTGTNQELYAAAGIPQSDWAGVEKIYGQESGVCHLKWEGQYGACPTSYVEKFPGAEGSSALGFGICQSTPANKMASEGEDWRTNPVTQMRWCYKYTLNYGSVQAAINFKYCLGSCYSPRTKTTVYKRTTWF